MSEQAQKSEVHEATDDATTSPANRTVPRPGSPDARGGRDSGGRANDALDLTGNAARGPDSTGAPADRSASPPSNFERGGAEKGVVPDPETPDAYPGQIGGGPGAGDASSGGGAGAGTPGGGTDMRTNGAFANGDVEEDRKKLFPDAPPSTTAGATADDLKVSNDPDESSFGGPLKIDSPDGGPQPNV